MRVLLIVYDNESYIHWFPQGTAYIAAVLTQHGIDVDIYQQDLHHWSESHLTELLDRERYDIVGLSTIAGYYQYRKLLALSRAVNRSKQRPFYVLGGHGPAPEPEYFLRMTGADAIVIGEGEHTALELFDALLGGGPLGAVQGIAYRDGDRVVVNERRPLIADIDAIPWPAYSRFPIEYYRLLRVPICRSTDFVMPVLSGRGCTFQCNFCYRMDKGFRPRSNEAIVDEMTYLHRTFGITFFAFSDELLMSSVERTASLCEAFLGLDFDFCWNCNGRLNFARPEVLRLMKRSGCVFINYGIEAFDDAVLKTMRKALTTDLIERGVEATLSAGISPGLNIIFGNIGEDRETLEKGVEFLLRYSDAAQLRTIRPVTPYPGSPLYYHAISEGLIDGPADFYENKHTNSDLVAVNFTSMSDDEIHRALFDANSRLIEDYFAKKRAAVAEQARKLYLECDHTFRGFRQT